MNLCYDFFVFVIKQKTAYEVRISDWSSDVCSSDLSFWQVASQLQYLYPDDWQTMVNNSKVVQCFGANTLLAAQTMAGLVGHPDPVGVLALPPDEMLLQVAGDIAVVAKLPNYRLDPAFAGLFDGHHYHDAAADPLGKIERAAGEERG